MRGCVHGHHPHLALARTFEQIRVRVRLYIERHIDRMGMPPHLALVRTFDRCRSERQGGGTTRRRCGRKRQGST